MQICHRINHSTIMGQRLSDIQTPSSEGLNSLSHRELSSAACAYENSNQGIEEQKTKELAHLIPKEIWAHILKGLKFEDLPSLYAVCTTWQQTMADYQIKKHVTFQGMAQLRTELNHRLESQVSNVEKWKKERHLFNFLQAEDLENQENWIFQFRRRTETKIMYLIKQGYVKELVEQLKEQASSLDSNRFSLYCPSNDFGYIDVETNAEIECFKLFQKIGIKNSLFQETLDIVLQVAKLRAINTSHLCQYFFQLLCEDLNQWIKDFYEHDLKHLINENFKAENRFIELMQFIESHLLRSIINDEVIKECYLEAFHFNKEESPVEHLQHLSLEIIKSLLKSQLFCIFSVKCCSTLAWKVFELPPSSEIKESEKLLNLIRVIVNQQKIYAKKTQEEIILILNNAQELKDLCSSSLFEKVNLPTFNDILKTIQPALLSMQKKFTKEESIFDYLLREWEKKNS